MLHSSNRFVNKIGVVSRFYLSLWCFQLWTSGGHFWREIQGRHDSRASLAKLMQLIFRIPQFSNCKSLSLPSREETKLSTIQDHWWRVCNCELQSSRTPKSKLILCLITISDCLRGFPNFLCPISMQSSKSNHHPKSDLLSASRLIASL